MFQRNIETNVYNLKPQGVRAQSKNQLSKAITKDQLQLEQVRKLLRGGASSQSKTPRKSVNQCTRFSNEVFLFGELKQQL